MNKTYTKGLLLALIAAVISGCSIFYNKLVVVNGIDTLLFNILKNGGVALVLTVVLLGTKRHSLQSLTKHDWGKLLLIGIIGGSIPFVLFFEGLKIIPAPSANFIQKTLFLWVALMAVPLLKEKLAVIQILGYVIVAWSNLFLGGLPKFTGSPGELMVLAATIFWSVENVIAKVTLKNVDATVVAWSRMFLGSIILLVIAVVQNKIGLLGALRPAQALPILGSIVFLTGYVTVWYRALKYAPATTVTAILILATPITNLLSGGLLTHAFPQSQLTQLLGLTIGVVLIAFAFKLPRRQPAPPPVS